MTKKSNFERLGPADQLAVESMVTKASKEELEANYKETKSKEAINKRFGAGDVAAIIFILAIVGFIFLMGSLISVYERALEETGIDVCQNHNSTYKDTSFDEFFHVTIICTDLKVRLPNEK